MIGKKIGKDNIYIQVSAVNTLPEHLKDRVAEALGMLAIDRAFVSFNFNWDGYNFVITHPDYIEFVEAEDFDNVYEPVLGKRYRVTNDGEVTYIPRPNKPRVLHQRYKTVRGDYCGFDIENDKGREEWYRSHFDARRMAGAGFEHKWQERLKEITADPDNDEFECEVCHGIFDIDDSISIAKGTLVCEQCAD